MTEYLPFHQPDFGEEEMRAVADVLSSGWLTTGPQVQAFEEAFAKYVGATYAVALNSCTAALHLALEAIGLQEGDDVLVPTMTFAATAEVVQYFKAKPVLVDCEPDTLNISMANIERAVTSRTKAIVPVHFAGHPCEMDQICQFGKSRGISVIEDAAHALPASSRGKIVGGIGDVTCFSFYVTKTMTTGEGGMATTDNPDWAQRMRMMSLHGLSRDAWKRYSDQGSWLYDIVAPGFKYNMTDIAAALGRVQLSKCERLWEVRQQYAERYHTGLKDLSAIQLPVCSPDIQHAWHLYVVRLNLDRLRITRNEFLQELQKREIGSSVHFIPLHLHSYYRKTYGYRPEDFPHASREFERVVSLPIYSKMTESDVDRVIQAIRTIVKEYRK